MDYMKHFIIPQHDNPLTNPYTIQNISAVVADMTDTAIHQAIIQSAKESGITDLYLMDKQFVSDALKEKLDRDNPKPLTIEELRQMVGEPVWIKADHYGIFADVVKIRGREDGDCFVGVTICYRLQENGYGKTWIAYRHKPKEVNHGNS